MYNNAKSYLITVIILTYLCTKRPMVFLKLYTEPANFAHLTRHSQQGCMFFGFPPPPKKKIMVGFGKNYFGKKTLQKRRIYANAEIYIHP